MLEIYNQFAKPEEIESMSPALAGDSLPLSHQGSSSLAEYMKSQQDDGKGVYVQ